MPEEFENPILKPLQQAPFAYIWHFHRYQSGRVQMVSGRTSLCGGMRCILLEVEASAVKVLGDYREHDPEIFSGLGIDIAPALEEMRKTAGEHGVALDESSS